MPRTFTVFSLGFAATLGAACTTTQTSSEIALIAPGNIAHRPVNASPYSVELLGEDGAELPTWELDGRYYVLGDAGERYTIHVSNPTDRRIEAVISVDGLDVVDGETADFAGKRGYVIPAGADVRLEGWRVSTTEVAAFRFSSVRSSYAGRKGQERNVGVIGVAIFREREQPQMILDERPVYRGDNGWDDYGGGGEVKADSVGRSGGAPAEPTVAPRSAETRPAEPSSKDSEAQEESWGHNARRKSTERAGLGTGFGENRHSAVMWTRFEREHPTQPTALAELRYNDATGLAALGLPVSPQLPDEDEMARRETADPFPGTKFATPPNNGGH